MDNNEVTEILEKAAEELEKRLSELRQLRADPGGAAHQLLERLDDIHFQRATLGTRLHHVYRRLRMRQFLKDLGEAVPPLSEERAAALTGALVQVGKSIAAAQTFDLALSTASAIATAAGVAARAGSA